MADNNLGSSKLLERPMMGSIMAKKRLQTMQQHQGIQHTQINDARIASFLTRASTYAEQICEAHEKGVVGEKLDRLKAQRNHWLKELKEAYGHSNKL